MTAHELTTQTRPGRASSHERFIAAQMRQAVPVHTRSYVSCSCGWLGPAYFETAELAREAGEAHVVAKARQFLIERSQL